MEIDRNRVIPEARMKPKLLLLMLVLLMPCVCVAQEPAAPPDAGAEETTGISSNIFTGPPVQLLDYPDPKLLTPAAVEALKRERKMFARELRFLPKYRPNNFQTTSRVYELVPAMSDAEVQKIVDRMEEGALNTVQDNNKRFRKALGERIPTFQQALDRREAGELMPALDTSVALTKEKILLVKRGYAFDTMPPYCYAAVKLWQAEVYGLAGAGRHCVVAYQIAYHKLPRSVSFGPTARIRAADLYERSERSHYAITIYGALLEQQTMNLVDTELLRLRIKMLRWMTRDPYRVGTRMVGDVTRRVSIPSLGNTTQGNQGRLIELMHAMVIAPEKDEHWFGENSMRLAGQPIDGAKLQKGGATEQFFLTNDVSVVGTDDWGALRPREKQELIQMFSETYSERYREMLEEYYRSMSIAETKKEDEEE